MKEKFYDLAEKRHIEVDMKDIVIRETSNGRKQAVATLKNGRKLYKFMKN